MPSIAEEITGQFSCWSSMKIDNELGSTVSGCVYAATIRYDGAAAAVLMCNHVGPDSMIGVRMPIVLTFDQMASPEWASTTNRFATVIRNGRGRKVVRYNHSYSGYSLTYSTYMLRLFIDSIHVIGPDGDQYIVDHGKNDIGLERCRDGRQASISSSTLVRLFNITKFNAVRIDRLVFDSAEDE